MGERDVGLENDAGVAAEEGADRGPMVVALSAAAVSGFLMGLLVRGEGALGLAVAVLIPAMVWSGWWLRGAIRQTGVAAGR